MSLWGKTNNPTSAPKTEAKGAGNADRTLATGIANNHGNTVWGVPPAKVANTKGGTAGWNRVRRGTGPVVNVTIGAGGTGYANTNYWRAQGGATEANGTITTNGSGVITAITVTNGGKGFANLTTAAITVVNSTGGATGVGTGATLTAVLGGRGGRVQYECLVAMRSMTANGAGGEFTNLP